MQRDDVHLLLRDAEHLAVAVGDVPVGRPVKAVSPDLVASVVLIRQSVQERDLGH